MFLKLPVDPPDLLLDLLFFFFSSEDLDLKMKM